MPVTPWPEPVPFTGRAAYAIAQTSYYASAVVGVGFVIGGAIAALIGVRELILPSDSETTREAVRSVLAGLAWAVPGLLFTWWHLREARNREGRLVAGVFWGRSLYFHLVAFIAGVTTLGGVTAALYALLDVVRAPECQPFYGDVDISGLCTDTAESLRAALNAAIVVIVAGAVWWWHLRGARRDPVAPAATSV